MSPIPAGIVASAHKVPLPTTDGSAYGITAANHGVTSFYPMNETSGTVMTDLTQARNGSYLAVGTNTTLNSPNPLYVGATGTVKSNGTFTPAVLPTSAWQNMTSFSVGMWFRPTSSGDILGVLSQYSGGSNSNWMIWQRRNRLNFYTWVSPQLTDIDNGPLLRVGFDYFLTVVISGTSAKFYVNGALQTTTTLVAPFGVLPDINVGAYSNDEAPGYYSGLAFFNGIALSDAQVLEQYNAGKIDRERTAQLYYKFDETAGPTMNDSSGKARHGTYAAPTYMQAALHPTNSTWAIKSNASGFGIGSTTYAEWMNTGEFTLTFWCRVPATAENVKAVASRWGSSNGWIVWWRSNCLGFLINGGTGSREVLGPTAVPNSVKKYAVRLNANVLSFFVDGVKVGSDATLPDIAPAPTHALQVGSYNGASNQSVAIYDSMKFYHVALSDAEILADYNADL